MTSAFLQSLRTDGGEPWNIWDVRDFIEKLRGKLRVETKHRYFSLFLMKISITFVSPRTAATVRWEARHQSDHSETLTEAHTAIFCLFWTSKSAQQKMIVVLKLNPGPHTGANIESRWQCKYTAPVVTGRLSRSHSLTSHQGRERGEREGSPYKSLLSRTQLSLSAWWSGWESGSVAGNEGNVISEGSQGDTVS